jgi:hypothetical protein
MASFLASIPYGESEEPRYANSPWLSPSLNKRVNDRESLYSNLEWHNWLSNNECRGICRYVAGTMRQFPTSSEIYVSDRTAKNYRRDFGDARSQCYRNSRGCGWRPNE